MTISSKLKKQSRRNLSKSLKFVVRCKLLQITFFGANHPKKKKNYETFFSPKPLQIQGLSFLIHILTLFETKKHLTYHI